MNDSEKTRLAIATGAMGILFPVVGLILGWSIKGFKTGLLIAGVLFGVFFLFSLLFLAQVRNPSKFVVALPFLMGALYNILPDALPLGLDDAAAGVLGGLLTFLLWLRRQPNTPRWIVIPLVLAGLYALVGGFIPGPLDELLVFGAAGLTAWLGGRTPGLPPPQNL